MINYKTRDYYKKIKKKKKKMNKLNKISKKRKFLGIFTAVPCEEVAKGIVISGT